MDNPNYIEVPDPEEMRQTFAACGGLPGMMPGMMNVAMMYNGADQMSNAFESMAKSFQVPSGVASMCFIAGLYAASLYFNQKYCDAIKSAHPEAFKERVQ